jgi:signal transduction histidine kinase
MLFLDSADSELRRLQVLLKDRVHEPPTIEHDAEIERLRARLRHNLDAYFALPFTTGETASWPELRSGLDEFELVAGQIVAQAAPVPYDTPSPLEARLDSVAGQLDAALVRTAAFNVSIASDMSTRIERVREGPLRWAGIVEAIAAIGASLAIVTGSIMVRRVVDESDRTVRLLGTRASELEAFSGRVAHDLLSPLTNVSLAFGHAEDLAERAADARGKRILERASASLQSVRRMVEALFEFARSGARPDPTACVEIVPVIRDMLEEHQELAERSGVRVSARDVPALTVACSAGILTGILSNLLQNAIRYTETEKERRVEVRVLEQTDFARVEVEDSGPGIGDEDRIVIFQPYVRRTSVAPAGLGLGLATVKRLVEAHGGQVGVESAPVHGSVFWFTLPLVKSAECGQAFGRARRTSQPAARM